MRRAGSAGSSGAHSTSFRGKAALFPLATSIRLLASLALVAGFSQAPAARGAPLRDPGPPSAETTRGPAATAAATGLTYNGTIGGLYQPFGAAINHLSRKIYVTEPKRNRVVVFDRLGRRRGVFGAEVLRRPTALAFDFSGNLAVLSAGSGELILFRRGVPVTRARVPAVLPVGLAFDPVSRRILVSDNATDSVWISRDGRSWAQEKPAGLTGAGGAAAAGGNFFVVSSADTRLMELSSTGQLFRSLPLRGAQKPFGVTIPPFGSSLVVSSVGTGRGLFAAQIGGSLSTFGGGARMATPLLPGSECTRVAFPDFTGDRLVVFNLPAGGSCTQGLTLQDVRVRSGYRRIVAKIIAEHDSTVSLRTVVSVPAGRGRPRRYRLRPFRTTMSAGIETKLRLRVPSRAAAGIRKALARRRRSSARLTFTVRNTAGDRRRVVGRLTYTSRALAASSGPLRSRTRHP